jgi:23S rRNA (cytidine1920-2'-O)/16S rRNA (cytidine1409-2'-O)-methyltransferase
VAGGAELSLRRDPEKYASRGGLKLEAALQSFAVPVPGAVVLDAGASTGGFTDCLLQHGAARVYAVDVGFGQLRGKLASDARVVNLERTNISDLRREQLVPSITLCTFDLSYLSARKAIPILAELFAGPVELIGLIKPLFEGVASGSMADPGALAPALLGVLEELPAHGLAARGLICSPVTGSGGTVEFLAWIGGGPAQRPPAALVEAAIAEASRLVPGPA